MAGRANFSDEEWNLLRAIPVLVAGGVSAADPSGLIGTVHEAFSGVKSMMESYQKTSQQEIIAALMAEKSMPTMPDRASLFGEGNKEQQLANFKSAVFGKVQEALTLLGQKASPEEVAAYKQMVSTVAERTANAAKEGGFLGFGGERVSAAEHAFLDQLKGVLG
jgi:hypothetical protein